jgi:hypothetical protein
MKTTKLKRAAKVGKGTKPKMLSYAPKSNAEAEAQMNDLVKRSVKALHALAKL